MPTEPLPITPGEQTTEYAAAQKASLVGIIGMLLGGIISAGAIVTPALGENTKWGIIAGTVITVASALLKALTTLGYIQARAAVKVAASEAAGK